MCQNTRVIYFKCLRLSDRSRHSSYKRIINTNEYLYTKQVYNKKKKKEATILLAERVDPLRNDITQITIFIN